jgi:transcriptional regulator with XRE-family HTH domain
MTTGQLIRTRRKRRKMDLFDLASACGIAVSTLSRYENDRLDPQTLMLGRIAAALGCGVRDLVPPRVRP